MKFSTAVLISATTIFSACSDDSPDTEVSTGGPVAENGDAKSANENANADAAQPTDAEAGEAVEAPKLITVDAIEGEPKVTQGDDSGPLAAETAVAVGDVIETGLKDKARLKFVDGSVLAIGPSSKITVAAFEHSADKREASVKVLLGQFWMRVAAFAGKENLVEVRTPNAVAGIRGTTVWGDTKRDVFCTLAGEVEIESTAKGAKGAKKLGAGKCVQKLSKGKLKPLKPKKKQLKQFLGEVHIGEPLPAE